MDKQEEFPILVDLQGNYQFPVFDLSGAAPFELYLNARRSVFHETDPRDLVILSTGSVFDFPAALEKGLVELVDLGTKEVISYHNDAHQVQAQQNAPPIIASDQYIILPTGVQGINRSIRSVPLHAALHLRPLVQPGREYRLQVPDKNLGVRWWAWGSPPESHRDCIESSPGETKSLVSGRSPCGKSFTVVSEIAIPPELSIGLSLAEEAHTQEEGSGANSEAPEPVIQITITNVNDRPIMLKTSGGQRHLLAIGEIPNVRARVTAERPDVQNFSIIDHETQEDLVSNAPLFISPLAGGSGRGFSRKQFLTLKAREPITRTARLVCRGLITGKEYHVKLRPSGCWWEYGTLDDLFGEGKVVLKSWIVGPKLPLPLASDDVVVFRYQGRE